MKDHPTADIFPLLPDSLIEELARDIADNGQQEPITIYEGKILDGRNRFRACKLVGVEPKFRQFNGPSPTAFVISENLKRRQLTPSQAACCALAALPHYEKEAKERQGKRNDLLTSVKNLTEVQRATEKAAEAFQTNRQYVSDAKKIQKESEKLFEAVRNGEVSMMEAKKALVSDKRTSQRREAMKAMPKVNEIIIGDFRSAKIEAGSLALIFTDPPYLRSDLNLYDSLGEFAAEKLCDGGSLLAYAGHYLLPQILSRLSTHLRYFWTCCCYHSGPKALMREYGLRVGWKPIVWFVKGSRSHAGIIQDTVTGDRQKDFHDWGQDVAEASHFIRELCPTDGIVCDPFLGGGTTAIAAITQKRKWIGMEIDPGIAAVAAKRITDYDQAM